MPAIPLPFVVSLFMAMLLARLILRDEPNLRPAIWFIAACTVTSTITGLRWSFDIPLARILQLIAGCLLPLIAWLCFFVLKRARARLWPYLAGAAAVFAGAVTAGLLLGDLAVAALYLGVGAALIRMALEGPDGFGAARLSDGPKTQASVFLAGVMLIISGIFDVLIGIDFALYRGGHVVGIIALGDVLLLPLLAFAVSAAGNSVTADEPGPEEAPQSATDPTADDAAIFEAFDVLMQDRKLFRDPDLTLNRLARRLGKPARQVSGAVNRLTGRNVSQVVNEYRIGEAKRLLSETAQPVTQIMLEAGFQTKSNFNREFLRVTGVSPSAWRQMPRNGGAVTATAT